MYAGTVMFLDTEQESKTTTVFRDSMIELRKAMTESEKIAKSRGWTVIGSYIETVEEYLDNEKNTDLLLN